MAVRCHPCPSPLPLGLSPAPSLAQPGQASGTRTKGIWEAGPALSPQGHQLPQPQSSWPASVGETKAESGRNSLKVPESTRAGCEPSGSEALLARWVLRLLALTGSSTALPVTAALSFSTSGHSRESFLTRFSYCPLSPSSPLAGLVGSAFKYTSGLPFSRPPGPAASPEPGDTPASGLPASALVPLPSPLAHTTR